MYVVTLVYVVTLMYVVTLIKVVPLMYVVTLIYISFTWKETCIPIHMVMWVDVHIQDHMDRDYIYMGTRSKDTYMGTSINTWTRRYNEWYVNTRRQRQFIEMTLSIVK